MDLEPEVGRRGLEFVELWAIQKRLVRQLDMLEEAIGYSKESGGVDLHRLSVFAGLTNSSRSTLEAIARTRGSEGTTIAVAQRAISEALREFAESLADELTGVADLAEGAPGAEEVAERLRAAVAQVGQLAVSAAQTALARTCAWANIYDPEATPTRSRQPRQSIPEP